MSGRRRKRGVAMMAVFWLLAVLSLAVFVAVQVVFSDLGAINGQKKGFIALQRAEMGIAVGANPQVEEIDYELLHQQFEDYSGFDVKLIGEGSRFNINYILSTEDRDLLYNIFTYFGIDSELAEKLPVYMEDWIDADDLRRVGSDGSEADYYEQELGILGYPFNRPFYSVDEMLLVRDSSAIAAFSARWRDFFTIYSGGRLDVNEASAELIHLACECDLEDAQDFVQMRYGPDGEENTEDDQRFQSAEEVMALLNVAFDRQEIVANRITMNDTTTRIESTGYIGDFKKRIMLVVRNRNNQPQILFREEAPVY